MVVVATMCSMIVAMKRNAVVVGHIVVGNPDIPPLSGLRKTKPMRGIFCIGISEGARGSVIIFMVFVVIIMILVMFVVIFQDRTTWNVIVLKVRLLEAVRKIYPAEVALHRCIKASTIIYILCLSTQRAREPFEVCHWDGVVYDVDNPTHGSI